MNSKSKQEEAYQAESKRKCSTSGLGCIGEENDSLLMEIFDRNLLVVSCKRFFRESCVEEIVVSIRAHFGQVTG